MMNTEEKFYVAEPCGHSVASATTRKCLKCRKRVEYVIENLQHKNLNSDLVTNDDLNNVCRCPITGELLHEPVLLSCGHAFDEFSIYRNFAFSSTCPVCREMSDKEHWLVVPQDFKRVVQQACDNYYRMSPLLYDQQDVYTNFIRFRNHSVYRKSVIAQVRKDLLQRKNDLDQMSWYMFFSLVEEFFQHNEILSKLWIHFKGEATSVAERIYVHKKLQRHIIKGYVNTQNSFFYSNVFCHIFFAFHDADHFCVMDTEMLILLCKYPSRMYVTAYEPLFNKTENFKFQCKELIVTFIELLRQENQVVATKSTEPFFLSKGLNDLSLLTARILIKNCYINTFLTWFDFREKEYLFLLMQLILIIPNRLLLFAQVRDLFTKLFFFVLPETYVNFIKELLRQQDIGENDVYKIIRTCESFCSATHFSSILSSLNMYLLQKGHDLNKFWLDFAIYHMELKSCLNKVDAQLLSLLLKNTNKDYVKTQMEALSRIRTRLSMTLNDSEDSSLNKDMHMQDEI